MTKLLFPKRYDGLLVLLAMAASRVSLELSKQAEHCAVNLAPRTGAIIEGISAFATGSRDSKLAQRITQWPRNLLEDAVGLRLCGGLHHMHLTSNDNNSNLKRLFHRPSESKLKQDEIDSIVKELMSGHEARLEKWLDTPPQTNEVGRSANFIGAFSWLNKTFGTSKFECFEIGSSGGINLLMPHYYYTYENKSTGSRVQWGNPDSSVKVKPTMMKSKEHEELTLNISDHMDFDIVSTQGCDLFPVDLRNSEEALRMKSFIWCDHIWRLELLDNAVETLKAHPPSMVKADAALWVEEQLGKPSSHGTCRVLMHSIVWQYLPEETRERITRVMHQAGKEATPDNPIAWVSLETNRRTFNHELTVRYWAGEGANDNIHEPLVLGEAQAHGRWMRWLRAE